jgi:hypothetical protein
MHVMQMLNLVSEPGLNSGVRALIRLIRMPWITQ